MYNAGETNADGRSFYVLNSTMAELAKKLGGIIIVMEHRFYGESMPGPVRHLIYNKCISQLFFSLIIYICIELFCRVLENIDN